MCDFWVVIPFWVFSGTVERLDLWNLRRFGFVWRWYNTRYGFGGLVLPGSGWVLFLVCCLVLCFAACALMVGVFWWWVCFAAGCWLDVLVSCGVDIIHFRGGFVCGFSGFRCVISRLRLGL